MYGGKLGKERKKANEAAIATAAIAAKTAKTKTTSEQEGSGNTSLLLFDLDVYNHPLADGGPLQRAVRTDMALLRDAFLHQWNHPQQSQSSQSSQPTVLQNGVLLDDPSQHQLSSHDTPGAAFSVFKEIFKRGSFAMLHTRTMPPK
eukprot:scaffold498115_cov86-Attheya_sp.AAC.1